MGMNAWEVTAMAFMAITVAFCVVVAAAFSQGGGRRAQGPPPEAYTACEGKSEGDKAEFESPRGDTVTGTCVQDRDGDQLVLHPDNPPGRGGRSGGRDNQ